MPPHVCSRCKFFMELFFEFKQICRKADASILSYLQTGAPLEPISWSSSLVKVNSIEHLQTLKDWNINITQHNLNIIAFELNINLSN